MLHHRGKVIAFENYDHMAREVERDDLDVTPDHILVLQERRPEGRPRHAGMGPAADPEEAGASQGVRDMVRISDARMSGTSYGACILHVAPESFVGGPFALVQTGDEIEIDVAARRIHLHVSDEELARRRAPGSRRRRIIRAATARCFRSISGRRTRAAISISCAAPRRPGAGDSLMRSGRGFDR